MDAHKRIKGMNVYIDKQNLVSYVCSANDSRFEDCNTMLKKRCDIKLTFSKEELKTLINDTLEKVDAEYIMMWFTKMSQGIEADIAWNINFPERPLKTNMHNSFLREDLSAVYLLDDEKVATVKNMGSLIIGDPGNELDALSQLVINDDNPYTKQFIPREQTSWNFIENYVSPTTDIIIVDRFLPLDQSLNESNLYAIIEKLVAKSKCKINCIIFSDGEVRSKNNTITPDWNSIRNNIKQRVEKITGFKPNITFVLKYKVEHDRTIFTNYKRYYSGDTFNYFDSNWKCITSGRHFQIDSMVSKDCCAGCNVFIDDMQAVIVELERINPDKIIGDKKSCYLKFN